MFLSIQHSGLTVVVSGRVTELCVAASCEPQCK